MHFRRWVMLALVAGLAVPAAQAQWVMVARAAAGRIQHLQQQRSGQNGGYDVATVILAAKADKVYQTAISAIQAHSPEVTLTETDAKKMLIKFTNGSQTASLQATSLGPTATQLVIASTAPESGPSGTSMVVQGVMKVCKDMNVTCTLEQ